jgi:hypothetical protein
MAARLTTALFVNALMRAAQRAGGIVTIVQHGDDDAGGVILICTEKGGITNVFERGHDLSGQMIWQSFSSQPIENKQKIDDYLSDRGVQDTDLWLVELDIPYAERFAADFIATG